MKETKLCDDGMILYNNGTILCNDGTKLCDDVLIFCVKDLLQEGGRSTILIVMVPGLPFR